MNGKGFPFYTSACFPSRTPGKNLALHQAVLDITTLALAGNADGVKSYKPASPLVAASKSFNAWRKQVWLALHGGTDPADPFAPIPLPKTVALAANALQADNLGFDAAGNPIDEEDDEDDDDVE